MIHDFTLAQLRALAREQEHDELQQKIDELEVELAVTLWKRSKQVVGNFLGQEITDWGGDENE